LPLPLYALLNIHVPLYDLVGDAALQLRDAACRLTEPPALFACMTDFLTTQLQTNLHPAIHRALACMLRNGNQVAVRDLVADSGFSHRRFNELFKIGVGMSPKRFARVCRFQQAITLLERQTLCSWQDVVAAGGFYDQAHLVNEFQAHAKMTPNQYLRQRGSRVNHPVAIVC